jgi:hypothetical protein
MGSTFLIGKLWTVISLHTIEYIYVRVYMMGFRELHMFFYSFSAVLLRPTDSFFPIAQQPLVGQGLLIIEASRSYSDTP